MSRLFASAEIYVKVPGITIISLGVIKFYCQYFPFPTFLQIEIVTGQSNIVDVTAMNQIAVRNKTNRNLLLTL